MNVADVSTLIGIDRWPIADRQSGRTAVALAVELYSGVTRDQGTPYLHHPVAVANIVREAGLVRPDLLVVALLHDVLEIRPGCEPLLAARLGSDCVAALRALTPDHRLAGRQRGPGDDDAYHRKVVALSDDLLAVKLSDRLHNLRELSLSDNPARAARFLEQLRSVYLPLAAIRGRASPPIASLTAQLLEIAPLR